MSDTRLPPTLQNIMRSLGGPSCHPRPPLTPEQFDEPPGPHLRLVFRYNLKPAEMDRVVEYAARFDTVDVCLAHHGEVRDLAFLRRLPPITRFDMYDFGFDAFEQFEHLPEDLHELRLSNTKSSRLSLKFLRRFTRLHTLNIEGHRKDIEAVGEITSLRDLELRSITLPDLSLLKPLVNLESLDIKLGGTKDLRPVAEFGKLRYLEVWQAKGLSDLGPIADLSHLQRLHLESLVQVRSLPSFANLRMLRRAAILCLKSITDISPVAAAPALEELHAAGMPHLEPASYAVFRGHPTLRGAVIGFGSKKKNAEVVKLLGLPSELDDHFAYVA
jgi:hypothetical protein